MKKLFTDIDEKRFVVRCTYESGHGLDYERCNFENNVLMTEEEAKIEAKKHHDEMYPWQDHRCCIHEYSLAEIKKMKRNAKRLEKKQKEERRKLYFELKKEFGGEESV